MAWFDLAVKLPSPEMKVPGPRAFGGAAPLTTQRAVWLSIVWLLIGLAVGLPLLVLLESGQAASYWAVYVLERSLSLDNVFVFLLVLDYFAIPRQYRRRVVRWGIVGALALRAAMIAAGATLIESLSLMTYVLGAVLLIFALRMLRNREEPMDPANSRSLRLVRRLVPLTPDASSGRFVARASDWAVTPLGLALVALILADVTFAVDSVSAAFGITTDVLVIWLANALALAGLIPLLFLVRALVRRFRYVSQTFAAVLAFIALQLLAKDWGSIGPLGSLAVILGILAIGLVASLIGDRMAPPPEPALAERRPPRCPPPRA